MRCIFFPEARLKIGIILCLSGSVTKTLAGEESPVERDLRARFRPRARQPSSKACPEVTLPLAAFPLIPHFVTQPDKQGIIPSFKDNRTHEARGSDRRHARERANVGFRPRLPVASVRLIPKDGITRVAGLLGGIFQRIAERE